MQLAEPSNWIKYRILRRKVLLICRINVPVSVRAVHMYTILNLSISITMCRSERLLYNGSSKSLWHDPKTHKSFLLGPFFPLLCCILLRLALRFNFFSFSTLQLNSSFSTLAWVMKYHKLKALVFFSHIHFEINNEIK